jgi:hypothetical protein
MHCVCSGDATSGQPLLLLLLLLECCCSETAWQMVWILMQDMHAVAGSKNGAVSSPPP